MRSTICTSQEQGFLFTLNSVSKYNHHSVLIVANYKPMHTSDLVKSARFAYSCSFLHSISNSSISAASVKVNHHHHVSIMYNFSLSHTVKCQGCFPLGSATWGLNGVSLGCFSAGPWFPPLHMPISLLWVSAVFAKWILYLQFVFEEMRFILSCICLENSTAIQPPCCLRTSRLCLVLHFQKMD